MLFTVLYIVALALLMAPLWSVIVRFWIRR